MATKKLHQYWGWLVGVGIITLILGIIAISAASTTTFISMLLFGWLLIIAGVIEAVYVSWRLREWDGFFMALLVGILHAVLGIIIVANPMVSAQALTMVLAFFFIFGGIFRIIAAIAAHEYNWGWLLFSGIVGLLLGISIWRHWPYSGLWIIGIFIGVEMLLAGLWLLMLGLAARKK